MKVCDLFENDWADNNQPTDMITLYKRQVAACEYFLITLQHLIHRNPKSNIIVSTEWQQDVIADFVQSKALFNYSASSMFLYYSDFRDIFSAFPKVKSVWNQMLEAKQKYEDAGGRYQNHETP